MVNPIRKDGIIAEITIFEGEFFEDEDDVIDNFSEGAIFECGECHEQYEDAEEAEDCCTEDKQ